jgi:hypothetical protein
VSVGQRARARWRHFNVLTHTVEHDKIVAGPMHFYEVPDHGFIIVQKVPLR